MTLRKLGFLDSLIEDELLVYFIFLQFEEGILPSIMLKQEE
jgi:hypothetical protein